jgi:predicted transposase/invertase (TIGR01784 family)
MNLMLPKVDFTFNLLFGDQRNRNILADFLKAALPGLAQEEFNELTIADPQPRRESCGGKPGMPDVKIRNAGGKSIDIKIQIADKPEMRSRISCYLASMISKQMARYYSDFEQVVFIAITDKDLIPESKQWHTTFRMLEKKEYFPFNGLMEIHVLNLKRLPEDGDNKLLNWLRFLNAEAEEEFGMLAEKDPVIREAYCKLQVMSEDEENRIRYQARLTTQE